MSIQQIQAVADALRSAPYDADASVGQQRDIFEQSLSRPVPDGVALTDTTLGSRPALEVAVAASTGPAVVLYLHGGGYMVGSARTGATLAWELAGRVNGNAYSLDYRLAPEHPFPAALDDAVAAYRDLLSRGHRPENLVIAGDSAGGGLTVATLLALRAAGDPLPASAVVFSPWVDLTFTGDSMDTKHGVDPLFTRDRIGAYAPGYLAGRDPAEPLVSPVFADLAGLPPLLVQVGSAEVLLDDATRLTARAAAGDVRVSLEAWPGLTHVFQGTALPLDEAGEALDSAGRFLRAAFAHDQRGNAAFAHDHE
ncbi:alpha/beta hydrolase [Spongisporangium articulatum]|uniref:Alpha/beta hydrolase n=1 Tax=Spongisporangium articulatum TaxID=3362603 RepID=A0ABW8ANT6_9ACTN